MSRRLLAIITALLLTSGVDRAFGETVWSGLVMANNVAQPTPIPAELRRLESTLKQLFGYNQFQVIGQTRQTLKTGEEDWRAASKYFSLQVDSKSASRGNYTLNLQLFQEQKLLLETEAKLSNRSPLAIKGPQVGDGQLVLVLVVD